MYSACFYDKIFCKVHSHYYSIHLVTYHKNNIRLKDCGGDVYHTPSYLCYLGQTTGDMIWQKTVPTPLRSLLWPVSWSCSEYCTALALQLLCNCKRWRKNSHINLMVWKQNKNRESSRTMFAYTCMVWINSYFMIHGLLSFWSPQKRGKK